MFIILQAALCWTPLVCWLIVRLAVVEETCATCPVINLNQQLNKQLHQELNQQQKQC